MYGGMWTIPVPDLDRTDYLLVLGANPSASQGSLLAAPDVLGRLDAIRARGGKVVRASIRAAPAPRRMPTSGCPIRPGTDALLLLAMVHVLFAEDLVHLRALAGIVNGVDDGARAGAGRSRPRPSPTRARSPPRRSAASRTSSRRRRRAAVYGRIGTCTQEFGTLASWLVEVLNVLTGNLDRPGGSMFANPVAWSMTHAAAARPAARLRVRSLAEPRPRRARGARPGPALVPRRGDRDARATARSAR